jgi:membrane protein
MKLCPLYRLLLRYPLTARLLRRIRKTSFPGLHGLPIFDVLRIFLRGVGASRINMRAGSVAFRLMLAFFPTLFFLVQMVAFVPEPGLPHRLLAGMEQLMPSTLFEALEPGLASLLFTKQSGLLSLSLFLGLWFSSNGILALIQAFNASAFLKETRPGWQQRLWALGITLLFVPGSLFVLVLLTWLGLWNTALEWFHTSLGWFVMALVLMPSIGLLFRLAPSKRLGLPLLSPGVLVASLFLLLFLFLLRWYAIRFYNWNEVFGLLGIVPLLMLFFYASAMALLLGFETNLSWLRFKHWRAKFKA